MNVGPDLERLQIEQLPIKTVTMVDPNNTFNKNINRHSREHEAEEAGSQNVTSCHAICELRSVIVTALDSAKNAAMELSHHFHENFWASKSGYNPTERIIAKFNHHNSGKSSPDAFSLLP